MSCCIGGEWHMLRPANTLGGADLPRCSIYSSQWSLGYFSLVTLIKQICGGCGIHQGKLFTRKRLPRKKWYHYEALKVVFYCISHRLTLFNWQGRNPPAQWMSYWIESLGVSIWVRREISQILFKIYSPSRKKPVPGINLLIFSRLYTGWLVGKKRIVIKIFWNTKKIQIRLEKKLYFIETSFAKKFRDSSIVTKNIYIYLCCSWKICLVCEFQSVSKTNLNLRFHNQVPFLLKLLQ